MRILAIDPGLNYPAAAISDPNRLWAAERVKIPGLVKDYPILHRCETIARYVVDWYSLRSTTAPDVLIVEWPRWYPPGKGKKVKQIDPNDLAGLCGIAGAAAGRLRERFKTEITVISPLPQEVWGNVPKATKGDPWSSPRGQRLEARLTELERACVQSKHDALDAAGLALFADGRWETRRLYPGAV